MDMPFESIDPTTGQRLVAYDALDAGGLAQALDRARAAYETWEVMSVEERAPLLLTLADLLERGRDAFARLMTREMGKPISEAAAEIEKCARACRYYAARAAEHLASEAVEGGGPLDRIDYRPLGAVLAIMPWNFPFWQAIRCAAPALAAGNVILLKHAPNVPQCAVAIEGLFARAGFPEGVFQNLFVEVLDLPAILDDPLVQGVSLTGSVGAGSAIAAEAGRRIKTTVLELGGSDPYIVMESADLDRAVEVGIEARMGNNGQSCNAAKRFFVQETVADEFERKLINGVAALRVGDPGRPEVDIGPLARRDLRDRVATQVADSVTAGAHIALGGGVPDRPGWFYEPTVLTGVPDACPASREEIFGPVASIFRVADLTEAIGRANATEFGLSAAIWTSDAAERDRAIAGLVAGGVFVNALPASDPRAPFGGVKKSGYGRELGPHALREFVNVRTVRVAE